MLRIVGTALALCLIATAAPAASIRDTLDAFEFFGHWAPHCNRPAAPDNSRREVVLTDSGEVRFTETLGEDYEPNIYVVLDARRTAPNTIVLRIELNSATRQDLTMTREDGRIRTMTNRQVSDGKLLVRNGVILANGIATPWLSRCIEAR